MTGTTSSVRVMTALKETEIVGLLMDAGNRLLDPPSSSDELFRLLEELEMILSKVDQDPSTTVLKALLPSMKALISDRILKNSESHIKIIVAACFNEIMRITAPDSPYDDNRMKEIFELTVSSFDKLSLLSCVSYPKVLSIIQNMAKVRSCLMMLDIDCDKLIIEMFEQFKRNLRSDHPPFVFLAMENIMSDIIDESEDIPLELLKVLLDCVGKEKENTSPVSWRLGAKVMERTCQKLKPFLRDAIKSGDIKKDDYSPLIDSVLQVDSETMEQKHVVDPTKQSVAKYSLADAFTIDSPAIDLNIDIRIRDEDLIANRKPSKALGHSKHSKASDNAGMKAKTQKENVRAFHSGGREASFKRPRGRPRKSSAVALKTDITSKDVVPTMENDMLIRSDEKKHTEASVKSSHSGKKMGRPRKDAAGSANKISSPKLRLSSSEKGKNRQIEETVFETPFGKKKYKEDIVGCRLKIWWPQDLMFYEGRITFYDSATGQHRVDYEDGDIEMLTLLNEHFEFIGDEIADSFVIEQRKMDVSLPTRDVSLTFQSVIEQRKMDAKPQVSSDGRENQDHSMEKTETPKDGPKDSIATLTLKF